MLFHALYVGSTGAGKTNALLYWLLRLFARKEVALVFIDPHGDAAFDLVRRIPESDRERVAIIDPKYVTFGLNPLSLPQGTEITNRVQVLHPPNTISWEPGYDAGDGTLSFGGWIWRYDLSPA